MPTLVKSPDAVFPTSIEQIPPAARAAYYDADHYLVDGEIDRKSVV